MTDGPEFQPACPGPPSAGPLLTEGPSGLVSGLYLAGGPLVRRSRRQEGVPSPGTIAVTDVITGETVARVTVARVTVARGQLATIPLAPGSYSIEGTCADALVQWSADAEPRERDDSSWDDRPSRPDRLDPLTATAPSAFVQGRNAR